MSERGSAPHRTSSNRARSEPTGPPGFFHASIRKRNPLLVFYNESRRVPLLLRRHLLIGIPPGADFQSPAYPAKIFFSRVRSGQRSAGSATHRASLRGSRPLAFHRLFGHLQYFRRDDRLGGRFLFHSCFHYRTDRLGAAQRIFTLDIEIILAPLTPNRSTPAYLTCYAAVTLRKSMCASRTITLRPLHQKTKNTQRLKMTTASAAARLNAPGVNAI